jgi:hypothetical protein
MNDSREINEKWATAALRIFSEKLEVEQITALIGLKPTRCYAKGDPISAGNPQLRHANAWLLKSDVAEDQSIAVHLGWLLGSIESKVDALRTLRQTCKVDCSVSSHQHMGRAARCWTRVCLNG